MNKDELTEKEKTIIRKYTEMLLELPQDQYEKHKRMILSMPQEKRLQHIQNKIIGALEDGTV